MSAEQLLIAAIVALSGVVTFLFKIVLQSKKECDEDRARLWNHINALEAYIDKIAKRVDADRDDLKKVDRPPRLHFEAPTKSPLPQNPNATPA